MINVTDVRDVPWTVGRRWWYDFEMTPEFMNSDTGMGGGTLLGPALLAAAWPFWFIAHWFGLPWRIVVSEDGELVDQEKVRGWRASQHRMQEIVDEISADVVVT